MDEIKVKIEKMLKEKSRDGSINCADARGIAEETGVSYGEVGEAANRLNIRIRNCELGCF